MTQLKNPTAGGSTSGVELHIDDLTRDQRTLLGRLTHRFRETAVAQVLVGPPETGKSTIAEMVGKCLEEQVETVHLSKAHDPTGSQKRLLFEAYGSYPFFLTAILKQLGFFARGEEPDLVEQLVQQLRRLRSEEKRLLLVIDDAQEMDPSVWKRLQSWLDYQDRGVRMIQVLLVGKPEFKRKMSEPAMRGWRRWVHGSYDLNPIARWSGSALEEAQRMLKRACESINEKTQPTQPIRPPHITWPAVQKIVKEAGGKPGRMNELLKRALSASIREGGRTIGYRFLFRADALRSPAMQWYKLRRAEKAAPKQEAAVASGKKSFFNPRGRSMKERTQNPRIPEHPLGWMRYALGTLLVVFALGAGWGITSWLSIETDPADVFHLADEMEAVDTDSEFASVDEIDEVDDAWNPVESSDPWRVDSSYEVSESVPSEEEYPLNALRETGEILDPLAESRTVSASLEREFRNLESSGFRTVETFPASDEVAGTSLEEETVAIGEETPSAETAADEEPERIVGIESLEDFSLPDLNLGFEEAERLNPEPIQAKATELSEELDRHTASTGTLSLPAPSRSTPVPKRETAAAPAAPKPEERAAKPAPNPSSTGERSASRERLLQAMSRLEKSLK